MPFKLRITFAGMCLLVPDQTRGNLHVLLPPTGGHGDHGGKPSRHAARLLYHSRYENSAADPKKIESIPMANALLDLTALVGDPALGTIPGEIVDVGGKVVEEQVSRVLLEPETHDRVLARLSLNGGTGKIPEKNEGAEWRIGTLKQNMAIKVEWTVTLPGTDLTLEIKGMNGEADHPVRVLKPIPEDTGGGMENVIRMYLFHSPSHEIPRELPPGPPKPAGLKVGDKATHFNGYYELIGPPLPICTAVPAATDAGIVAAVGQGGAAGAVTQGGHHDTGESGAGEAGDPSGRHGGADTSVAGDLSFGEEFTCILARAPLEPE